MQIKNSIKFIAVLIVIIGLASVFSGSLNKGLPAPSASAAAALCGTAYSSACNYNPLQGLTWGTVTNATGYEIQIFPVDSKGIVGTTAIINRTTSGINSTSYMITSADNLQPNTIYAERIRGVAGTRAGAYSGWLYFKTPAVSSEKSGATWNFYLQGTLAGQTVTYNFNPTTKAWQRVMSPIFPTITSFSPTSALKGSQSFVITVNGTGFSPVSVVELNRVILPTTYVSPTQLKATVPTTSISTDGVFALQVANGIISSSRTNFPVMTPTNCILGRCLSSSQINTTPVVPTNPAGRFRCCIGDNWCTDTIADGTCAGTGNSFCTANGGSCRDYF